LLVRYLSCAWQFRHLISPRKAFDLKPNLGQTSPAVNFLSRWIGHTLFLTAAETTLRSGGSVWKLHLIGANPHAEALGLDPLQTYCHYLIGGPQDWHTGLQVYSHVEYQNVYPGVDLVYHGDQTRVQYDLVLNPGADPSEIRLRFEGGNFHSDVNGDTALKVLQDESRHASPGAFQLRDGNRQSVGVHFRKVGTDEIGLEIGEYDHLRPLVITDGESVGASDQDATTAVAVDESGNTYVTGPSESISYPETAAPQPRSRETAGVFVAKLSPAGEPLYITYLGGSGEERAHGIAVDSSGQ